jgi:hypothetical protein
LVEGDPVAALISALLRHRRQYRVGLDILIDADTQSTHDSGTSLGGLPDMFDIVLEEESAQAGGGGSPSSPQRPPPSSPGSDLYSSVVGECASA